MRLVAIFAAIIPTMPVFSKPLSSKLNQVKKEIQETRLQITRYENLETSLGRDASELRNKNLHFLQQMQRLKQQALLSRNKEKELSLQLASLEEDSTLWSASLKEDLRTYLASLETNDTSEKTGGLWKEELIRFSILREASMLRALRESGRKAIRAERESRNINTQLIAQSHLVFHQSEQSLNAYEEKRALLQDAERKKIVAQEKEKRLEESAQALTKLLRIISHRTTSKKRTRQTTRILLHPHSLLWPAQGVVSSLFGRQKNPELGTWVIHQGIVIKTAPGAPVESVAAGKVIFSGPFRSYGKIIILDHGKNFFSIYGYLGTIFKKPGENVSRGETVALSAPKSIRGGNLYFELRQGTVALNPLQWLSRHE